MNPDDLYFGKNETPWFLFNDISYSLNKDIEFQIQTFTENAIRNDVVLFPGINYLEDVMLGNFTVELREMFTIVSFL